jgi:hypothetical protein
MMRINQGTLLEENEISFHRWINLFIAASRTLLVGQALILQE